MTANTTRIDVSFPGGKRVDATLGNVVIHTDQSKAHGGAESAPEPFDLFLASLATCAGLYVLVFCQTRGIPTEQLSLVQEQLHEDGKLSRIQLRILLPPGFPEKYVDAVRAAANGCRVKKTLSHPPDLEVVAVPFVAPAVSA
jgi:ribosomal protein S12 methylthiotransferase accessory factor